MKNFLTIICMTVLFLSCKDEEILNPVSEPQSAIVEADSTDILDGLAKARVGSTTSYTASLAMNSWTVGTYGTALRLNCASYAPGIRAKIIAQSGNKFTVQIQRNDGRPFNGTGIGYIKASNLCGNIAGNTSISNRSHYYVNIDFWATFTSGWVAFHPTITIDGQRFYANPITVTAKTVVETYTKDNCTHLAKSQCVEYARCRKSGSTLPYGLWTYQDKVRIINTYTPTANSVAVIKVGSGTNGNGVGHVAYVEKVEGNIIYIAESNWTAGKITRRSGTVGHLNITGFFR